MVLARLLTPVETGLFSVAAGLVNIAQAVRDFGVGNYILQERDLTRSRLAAALWVSVGLGCLLCVAFVAAAPAIAAAFHDPRLRRIVMVLSLNFIIVGFAAFGSAQMRREMNFRALSVIGIVSAAAGSVMSVIMAALGFGALGMAWSSVIGVATGLAGVLLVQRGALLMPDLREWRRVCGFGAMSMTGTILSEIAFRAPDVVIGRMLGFAMAGYFSRGNGLITLFEQAFLNAVMPVVSASLATQHRDGKRLAEPFNAALGLITVTSWPLLAVMAALATPMIMVMFGDTWLRSVAVARPLCLAGAFLVAARTGSALMIATGAMRSLVILQAIGVPLRVAGLAVGAAWGISGAAWGFAATCVVHAALSLWLVRSLTRLSLSRTAATLGGSTLATVCTMAAALPVLLAAPPWFGQFLLSGAVALAGLTGWLAFVAVSGHPIGAEIRGVWPLLRQRLMAKAVPF
jgi:O-antigen/teichoic acid export membrane protein